jgi:RND family efflux transporter MFP subunit
MSRTTQLLNRQRVIPGHGSLLVALAIWAAATGTTIADSADGFLEPYRRIHLASPETGVITRMLVEDGDVVEAGQVLATLDNEIFTAALAVARHEAESKAQLTTAQAQLRLRETRLEKLSQLFESGHAQAEEVERARTDLAIAEGAVLSAREYLEYKHLECQKIEAQISRRKIVAPMDGCVTMIHKREGEVVSPADPNVLILTKLDILSATFLLSFKQARLLQEEQQVTLSVPDRTSPIRGTVEFVSPVADAESGTLEVRVRVPNSDGKLLSGERCTIPIP